VALPLLGPTTLCLDADERPWVAGQEGVCSRLLRFDAASGDYVVMARFDPGVRTATHRHTGAVHAFTLAGAWRYLEHGFVARAGSYVHEPAGATHTLVVPEENEAVTEVLFVVSGGNVYFDADGTYLGFDDGHAVYQRYLRNCEEQGLGVPDGILV
jgi:2,4'-dihydroxyacetophenone dioxygenase